MRLDNYLVENPDTIVYVSVLEDEVIRDFEKEFKEQQDDQKAFMLVRLA